MAFRPGFVYLLRKHGDPLTGRVVLLAFAYVMDMYATEKRFHDLIADVRYESLEDVKSADKYRGALCKIGRTGQVVHKRVAGINSNWKSGHTEWARLNWWLRTSIRMRLWWLTVKPLAIVGILFLIWLSIRPLIIKP